jgi:aminoglycoside phosphotransferase (APT) family kinase protein
MHFEIIGNTASIETVAPGRVIGCGPVEKGGRRRKLKSITVMRLPVVRIRGAEFYWYEAHGIGRAEEDWKAAEVSVICPGKPIALGRTAEVYAYENGRIVKLFRDWVPMASAEYEARIARVVYAAGLPVPAVGDVIEIDGRLGLTYARVEGVSMLETLKLKPWTLFRFAHLLAELHVDMHTRIVPELPSERQRLENRIREIDQLPTSTKRAVLKTLEKMPDGNRLCHGDFHPGNVLITAEGPSVIDWMDATRGNPLADVARTSLLLSMGTPLSRTPAQWLLESIRRWFREAYLKRYFQLRPGDRWQLSAWQPIIAAARLRENITEEQARLVALVKAGLSRHDYDSKAVPRRRTCLLFRRAL